MKKLTIILICSLAIMCVCLLLTSSCKKKEDLNNPTVPVITTDVITNIIQTTATCGGNVTSQGSSPVTARGVCWSTSQTPTISDSKTTDGTGTGSFTSNITGLTVNTPYYVRAYATNSTGTGYGNEISFTPVLETGTVTDIEGNVYQTIKIGTQWWMSENLKTTKYNDGTSIPLVEDYQIWSNIFNVPAPAYCWFNNTVLYKDTYGALYNWHAVNTGILAPTGWHVPTDAEWTILTTYLGGEDVAGGKMKEVGTTHWTIPNAGATNSCGFNALPAGWRHTNGMFEEIAIGTYFWATSPANAGDAWNRYLNYSSNNIIRADWFQSYGYSVRCIKD
jgi:uncharacterized protein (TIGR02145 family)